MSDVLNDSFFIYKMKKVVSEFFFKFNNYFLPVLQLQTNWMALHAFFNKQQFYKQRQAEIGKKSSKC